MVFFFVFFKKKKIFGEHLIESLVFENLFKTCTKPKVLQRRNLFVDAAHTGFSFCFVSDSFARTRS